MSERLSFSPNINTQSIGFPDKTTEELPLAPELQVPAMDPQLIGAGIRMRGEEGAVNFEALDELVDSSKLALNGLRRAIAERKLSRAEGKIEDLSTSSEVRKEVVSAIHDGRLPHPDSTAVTHGERRTAMRASKRRTRVMNRAANQIRKQGVHGSSDAHGRPFFKDARPTYEVVDDGNGGKKVVVRSTVPAGLENDLGTERQIERLSSGRYPNARVKSELSTARKFNRDESGLFGRRKTLDKIERAIEGEDIPSRFINRRLRRKQKKVEKLNDKLDRLEEQDEGLRQNRRERRANQAATGEEQTNEHYDRTQPFDAPDYEEPEVDTPEYEDFLPPLDEE